MTELLQKWIESYKLNVTVNNDILIIKDFGTFLIVTEKEIVFDSKMYLVLDEIEKIKKVDYYLFYFGNKFYYCKDYKNIEFNLFRYIGTCNQIFNEEYPYLGIHSGYELLNGSGTFEQWCKKAKFYGYKTLGVCERNTLGGILAFQFACKSAEIKAILGEEIVVRKDNYQYCCKLYVINEEGWLNLLSIHKIIKIESNDFINEDQLIQYGKGLVLVLNPDVLLNDDRINLYLKSFEKVFYQLDTVIWKDNERDSYYLRSIKNYLDKYRNIIEPVLINDSYYIDKEDYNIKPILNIALGKTLQNKTDDQYFKNLDDNYLILSELFEEEERLNELFLDAIKGTYWFEENCNYKIPTDKLHLPKFDLNTIPDKYKGNKTNEDLFWQLIEEGCEKKLDELDEIYKERIEREASIIIKFQLIDYFLILWDIVRWCKENNTLVGVGRGSSGGSIICYLLDITQIDPLKYDLLFERFLNSARLKGGSMADVDLDFEGSEKDRVKDYIKSKYGEGYFCSVGTYTTLKIKAGIQDLGRIKGISAFERNFITTRLDTNDAEGDSNWKEIFENAIIKKSVKDFVIKNTELIEDLQICLNQPKNTSIHASANIILPKTDWLGRERDIFHWIPVKKEGDLLISEWEGTYLEKAGFLKEDLLGIRQLEKFKRIVNLVKRDFNVNIDIYNLPLDNKKVYEYFKKGWTADSFHFGSLGLTSYTQLVKPDNIEDLIAMISLFRPGVIKTGAHIDYVNLKEGKKEPEYDYMLEEVTKNTYGIYIYQEEIIKACQVLGGFTLVEGDDVRKCLYKDTYIWTQDGYYQIKDLKKKNKILTYSNIEYKNKLNSVNRVFYSGEKECVKLIFKSGRELICTKDHRIYTSEGWVNAKDCVNKYILHEVQEKYGTCYKSFYELYIIIALITEGSLSGCVPCFVNQDKNELNTFTKAYKKIFHRDPKSFYYNKKSKCTHINILNSDLLYLGVDKELSDKKELPDYFLRLNKRALIFSIAKLIDFDGYVSKEGGINYCTKSKRLADQFHLMIECLGVKANLRSIYLQKYQSNYYEVFILDQRDIKILHSKLKIYSYKVRGFDNSKFRNNLEGFSSYQIPYDIWYLKIKNLIDNSGYKWNELINAKIYATNQKNITIDKLNKLLKITGRNKELEFFIKKKVYWEIVEKIEEVGIQSVYDFSMSFNCIPQAYANGILVHNSMGKKNQSLLDSYKLKFIEGAIKNGCEKQEAEKIWSKLETFAGYGFNKSHATAYAITGYISMWLKVNYPLQFWVTAFEYINNESKIARFLSEINKSYDIKIIAPDINYSSLDYTYDLKTSTIYWSLIGIKQVGESAVDHILEERNKNGHFYSLEEFLERVPKKKVNKRVIEALIYAGAFDTLEKIKLPHQRINILQKYYQIIQNKESIESMQSYQWILKQKEITGLGYLDFPMIIKEHSSLSKKLDWYIDTVEFFDETKEIRENRMIAGIIQDYTEKNSKNGYFGEVTLNVNDEPVLCVIWSGIWEKNSEKLRASKNKILIITGKVVYSKFKNVNCFQTEENTLIDIL